MANTASTALEDINPQAALALNPANRDAAIAFAFKEMEAGRSNAAAASLHRGMVLSPADARFHSLLGLLAREQGDTERAEALFDAALAIAPGEIQALVHKLNRAVESGEMEKAAARLEILARRWPRLWDRVKPVLPAILSSDSGFKAILLRFGADGELRRLLISSLIFDERMHDFASRLILAWLQDGDRQLNSAVNQLVANMLKAGRDAQALALFQASRTGEARLDKRFIHNAGFDREPSGNAFDWLVERQSGVSIQRVKAAGGNGEREEAWHMQVRFLDSPVRLENLKQMTSLPPGNYKLTVGYSAKALRMPQPAGIAVTCLRAGGRLAEAAFESGDRADATALADFTVPANGCLLQQLALQNGNPAETWRNRFSGTLTVHSVSIERHEAQ